MVHLQDKTRYVSNPDGILSSSAVAEMDRILYELEQKTGIQTLVVVVTGIEGGDCFDFAYRLGKEMGVGQKERDNGLVILLSTDERCIQFATGYVIAYLVYQIGTIITTGAPGAGFIPGLIVVAAIAAVVIYLIRKADKTLAAEYALKK